MRLKDYVESLPNRYGALSRLARKAEISFPVVSGVYNGTRTIKRYETAKRLSDATGGAVSIADLCEAPPPKRKRASGERGARQ